MRYRFTSRQEIPVSDRWLAVSPKRMGELDGRPWDWLARVQDQRRLRTHITLAVDRRRKEETGVRPVVIRSVVYRSSDTRSAEAIERRRSLLSAQLEMLNRLQSPLLPEPLDWVVTQNRDDGFPDDVPRSVSSREPLMILDWIDGSSIDSLLRRGGQVEGGERKFHIARAARIARRLLRWLEFLESRRVLWFATHPSNILLTKNDVPRILGLSGLCPLRQDGRPDRAHPGYLRTQRGYFPPEIDDESDFANRPTTPLTVGVYGLGALLAQMVVTQSAMPASWLKGGTFDPDSSDWQTAVAQIARPDERDQLLGLVAAMCAADPSRRLTDPEQIRAVLNPLAGDHDTYSGTIIKLIPQGQSFFGFIRPDVSDLGGGQPEIYFKEQSLAADMTRLQISLLLHKRVTFRLQRFGDGKVAAINIRRMT